jgi:hypothetical protein
MRHYLDAGNHDRIYTEEGDSFDQLKLRENPNGQTSPLTVEFFGAVPNFSWLKQVNVKLPTEVANSSEIRISLKGVASLETRWL